MKPENSDIAKGVVVRRMFDGIAPRYDLLNTILSLGIDRLWRRAAVRELSAMLRAGAGMEGRFAILDVATGTGDMAVALARALPEARITGVDISEGMLAVGRERLSRAGGSVAERVTLVPGDAARLAEGSFDGASVAFGVRNFEDIEEGIRGMRRALRPGGAIAVLEFSTPRGSLFGALYRLYFHRLLPLVGGWVSGDGEAYRYLPRSVDGFPSPENFVRILRSAGFTSCRARSLTFGVAYLYTGVAEGD